MRHLAIFCLGLLILPTTHAAQKKNKTPSKAAASKALTTAKNDLRDAQSAYRKAERELAAARSAASAKHLKASGLTTAQNTARTAASNLTTIRKAVTHRVREGEDHIAATNAAKDAGVKLRQLNNRPKMSEDRKRQRRSELSAIIRRPVEMERAAIEADSMHARMEKEARDAGQAVAKAAAKYQKLLNNDATIKKATTAYNEAKSKLKKAEIKVANKNRELQTATRAEAQAKRQQAAKKRNQNNKSKGKNNRNKNKRKK